MHFVLVPTGSSGDVNPFLGIARKLIDRGHEVTVVTSEPFASAAKATGARFVSHQSSADMQDVVNNPDLWHPTRGPQVLFSETTKLIEQGMAALDTACRPDSFLVGHTISFHVRTYEELHGNRAATVHLAPAAFRSNNVIPAPRPGWDLRHVPRPLLSGLWRLLDRFILDPSITPEFNRWRARQGLPPIHRIFKSWIHSPQGVIGLFPEWFAPRQPDWPSQLHLTGFPLHDDTGDWTPDPAVESFLASGEAPILFAHGTLNAHAEGFFRAAIEATARMGTRAIVQTAYRDQLPEDIPAHVLHVRYVPFSSLLPRCRGIVHHGGIGTSSQGLAAGIPQLTVPMGFDQPDNTTHLMRLGVADWISPSGLTGTRLARKLEHLFAGPSRAERCSECQQRLQDANALSDTADLLESWASS